MEEIGFAGVVLSFAILALASVSDWRTRTAPDRYWVVLGIIGLILLALKIYLDGDSTLYFLFLVPVSVLFFDIFWERKGMFEDGIHPLPLGLYLVALVVLVILLASFWTEVYLWQLMTILIMFGLIILLYQINVVKGGADAKALLALSIVFPSYPAFGPFPLVDLPMPLVQYLFPFSLLILFNAALIFLFVPLGFLAFNLTKGDKDFPVMLFGYRMSVQEARKRFVWPMEIMEGGKRRVILFPKSDESHEKQLDDLEKAGAEEIWVTPKVPFLIPITASILFSSFVGNVIFLFLD